MLKATTTLFSPAFTALHNSFQGREERLQLLRLYIDKYIRGLSVGVSALDEDSGSLIPSLALRRAPPPPPPIAVAPDVDDALLGWAADKTEGFSGRELAKLVTGVRAAVYGSADRSLGSGLFRAIVDFKAAEHAHRAELVRAGHHGPAAAMLAAGGKKGAGGAAAGQ